jgi:nucleoside-diphosphate-sugar epimerase
VPELTHFADGTLVTGSAGFLGSHLCDRLRLACPAESLEASASDPTGLDRLARRWRTSTVVHLASKGTVVGPRSGVPQMLDATVNATAHLLDHFHPSRFLLASSCAVHGNTGMRAAVAGWQSVHPVSVYGLSKAMAELILDEWSGAGAGRAVVLRFGNLVGPGARGLVSYLVRHALTWPDGSKPACMRGGGALVRDYIPVSFAVSAIQAALSSPWDRPFEVLNVGSGSPRTNRDIADIVTEVLAAQGIVLRIKFADEPAFGEARASVLDCEPTFRRLGISPPGPDEVTVAVRDSVLYALGAGCERSAATRAVSV